MATKMKCNANNHTQNLFNKEKCKDASIEIYLGQKYFAYILGQTHFQNFACNHRTCLDFLYRNASVSRRRTQPSLQSRSHCAGRNQYRWRGKLSRYRTWKINSILESRNICQIETFFSPCIITSHRRYAIAPISLETFFFLGPRISWNLDREDTRQS